MMTLPHAPFVTAMIIPTGVGATQGGFGGDAMPYLNLLASVSDVLVTHPNVANAAAFQKLPENALYVEGYGLDQFMQNRWALRPVRANRIGVIFDAGIDQEMLILHLNTMNAVKTVYGVDILGHVVTEAPVDTGLEMTSSGCSSGYLKNPSVILNAARKLMAQGATAIALCVQLPEPEDATADEEAYKSGGGVDPIGGIEAILSHLIVSEFKIPCAHAPVFPYEKARPVTDELIDPRAASEFITATFMPCILTGLSKAPQFADVSESTAYELTLSDVHALVVPADALGGIPVLSALQRKIPIIAAQENQTVLNMDATRFPAAQQSGIRFVRSYEEAAGVLQAMKIGLALPEKQRLVSSSNGISALAEIL